MTLEIYPITKLLVDGVLPLWQLTCDQVLLLKDEIADENNPYKEAFTFIVGGLDFGLVTDEFYSVTFYGETVSNIYVSGGTV